MTSSDTDAADIGAFAPAADGSDLRGMGPFSGPALRVGSWGLAALLVGLAITLLASNGPSGAADALPRA